MYQICLPAACLINGYCLCQVNSMRRVRLCIQTGTLIGLEFSPMAHLSTGARTGSPTMCLCGKHGVSYNYTASAKDRMNWPGYQL